MTPCTRGDAPDVLVREGPRISRDYAARRHAEPSHRFDWPKRDGQRLLAVIRDALGRMTAQHCSYCDGHPLDATGVPAVDHFKPKSRPEFYELVCEWTNLFLTCTSCNNAKREHWEDGLLRPDDAFVFERYFEFHFDTGELRPAPTAAPIDQLRAARTIEVFQLNRSGACKSRLRVVKQFRAPSFSLDEQNDYAYRYLIPFCLAA